MKRSAAWLLGRWQTPAPPADPPWKARWRTAYELAPREDVPAVLPFGYMPMQQLLRIWRAEARRRRGRRLRPTCAVGPARHLANLHNRLRLYRVFFSAVLNHAVSSMRTGRISFRYVNESEVRYVLTLMRSRTLQPYAAAKQRPSSSLTPVHAARTPLTASHVRSLSP